MSASNNKPIENAIEVIERFGGIRPMAKKIDVAVTTIQGWKKRDVIPAARREVILEAAQTHNVDLTDILPDAPPANENRVSEPPKPSEQPSEPVEPLAAPVQATARTEAELEQPIALEDKLAAVEKKVVSTNTWLALGLIVVVLAAAAALLWPKGADQDVDRLAALEARTQEIAGDVEQVKDQQSFFGTLIPENLDDQLASLQEQAGEAKQQLGQAMEKVQEVSDDVLADDAGTIVERMEKLETHLQDVTGSPVLAGMLEKMQGMQSAPEGQSQLDNAMVELSSIMGNLGGQLAGDSGLFESTLNSARGQSAALGQTFEDVPTTDLKAAAMLLAMTQFRSSLNRDNDAFEQDLGVLLGLVGEDDTALRASLARLAPHAQGGVLTPAGLSDEFKTMAGDAVVASLQGDDVSVSEKTTARFNDLFQVEKDGELITGTPTQATVNSAGKMLEEGDLEGAISAVQTLDGPAAAQMSGWLNKAQATLMAQKVQAMLGQTINMKAYGGAGGLTAGSVLPGSSTLIQNEETGINILRRNTVPGMPNMQMPKDANPYR